MRIHVLSLFGVFHPAESLLQWMQQAILSFMTRNPRTNPATIDHVKAVFRDRAWRMNSLFLHMIVDYLRDPGHWPEMVKTETLVGNRERKNPIIFQNAVAFIKETDEIGSMLY